MRGRGARSRGRDGRAGLPQLSSSRGAIGTAKGVLDPCPRYSAPCRTGTSRLGRRRRGTGTARRGSRTTPDPRQRQLTRMGNAAWAAGLAHAMAGRRDESREWLLRAAARYRESYAEAPPGSWGRPIAVLKALLLAGEDAGGGRPLDAGRGRGRGGVADRALRRGARARGARRVGGRARPGRRPAHRRRLPDRRRRRARVPRGRGRRGLRRGGRRRCSRRSCGREGYLEDVAVADTVLVLQALAARRGMRRRPQLAAAPRYVTRSRRPRAGARRR